MERRQKRRGLVRGGLVPGHGYETLCDPFGVVANPLDLAGGMFHRYHLPQVARHRMMAHQRVQTAGAKGFEVAVEGEVIPG